MARLAKTYVHRVDIRHPHEVRPVDELDRLLAHAASEHTVCEAVNIPQLIVPEDEQRPTPHLRLGGTVLDSILEIRHDSEIVASALQSPEKIRVLCLGDGDCRTVGHHQACGYQVVGQQALAALKPSVAAA